MVAAEIGGCSRMDFDVNPGISVMKLRSNAALSVDNDGENNAAWANLTKFAKPVG